MPMLRSTSIFIGAGPSGRERNEAPGLRHVGGVVGEALGEEALLEAGSEAENTRESGPGYEVGRGSCGEGDGGAEHEDAGVDGMPGVAVGAIGAQPGLGGRGGVHAGGGAETDAAEHDEGGAGGASDGAGQPRDVGHRPGRAGGHEDGEEGELGGDEEPTAEPVGHCLGAAAQNALPTNGTWPSGAKRQTSKAPAASGTSPTSARA